MDFKSVSPLLVAFAEQNQSKWNELDGAQGDGDLGVTLVLASKALAENAAACGSVKEWFQVGGKAVRKAAPSTMGILIASALIAAGKSIEERASSLNLQDWVLIQQSMVAEIQKRGGAKLGDKTVLDAFIPAVNVFIEGVNSGKNQIEVVTEATSKAKQGAEETSRMVSKIGRSSWLGQRAHGHIDGGAWVCFQVYEFILSLIKSDSGEHTQTN